MLKTKVSTRVKKSYREALIDALSVKDFTAVVKALVKEARRGRPWAVKEILALTLPGVKVATTTLTTTLLMTLLYRYRGRKYLDVRSEKS